MLINIKMSKRISRSSTCMDLLDPYSIDLYCDRCAVIMDMSNSKRARDGATKRNCLRLQDTKYGKSREQKWYLKHAKVREALGIPLEFDLLYETAYSNDTDNNSKGKEIVEDNVIEITNKVKKTKFSRVSFVFWDEHAMKSVSSSRIVWRLPIR